MIKLNTFTLEKFSSGNREHRRIVNELSEDVFTRKNISKDLNGFIKKLEEKSKEYNNDLIGAYVASLNRSDENVPVGICGVDMNDYRFNSFLSLLEKYRDECLDFILEDQFEEYLMLEQGLKKVESETFVKADAYAKAETPVKKRTRTRKTSK